MWDLGAQGGSAKAPARNNAPAHPVPGQSRKFVYVYVFYCEALSCLAVPSGVVFSEQISEFQSKFSERRFKNWGGPRVPNFPSSLLRFAIAVVNSVSLLNRRNSKKDGSKSVIKCRQSSHMFYVTLPALQKHFVNIFFVFAWEFCIEKWRGFWWIFSGLCFPQNEAR